MTAPEPATPLSAVREVTRALLRGEDPETVLLLVAGHARRLVGADLAAICVVADRETMTVRTAVGRNHGRLRDARFRIDGSLTGHVLVTEHAEIVDDAHDDPRADARAVELGGVGPAIFVPLACREGACGVLSVANRRGGRRFDPHDLELVETFAGQASLVLDMVRAEERIAALLATADRERTGRTLHDTVIQRLFAAGMTLEAARTNDLPAPADAKVARALDDLDETIREIRATVFDAG